MFTNFIHDMCEWRIINIVTFQYHGLENLVENQRNVTMAACMKSIGGIYSATTDFVTLSIFLSSGPCQIWLLNLKEFVIVPSNNWMRGTIGAMLFVIYDTTDILNWSDLATWCFCGLRRAEYNEWIRVHGELSLRLVRTYIST